MAKRFLLGLCLSFAVLAHTGAAVASAVVVGDEAPGVELPSLHDGKAISLESLRGNVVYLDFWASWCGPCRISFPILEAMRSEFGSRGFEVLAINVDEQEQDALSFMQDVDVSYPLVRDASGDSPSRYGILGMPTGYLIDREGIVREVHQGFRKSDGAKLRAAVEQLLGE